MIRLSDRYAWPLAALLSVALVPVAWHAGDRRQPETCAGTGHRLDPFGLPGAGSVRERGEQLGRHVVQWTEGRVSPRGPTAPRLEFTVLRSFDPARLYVRPANFVSGAMEPERHELEWLATDGEPLPIHWISDETRRRVQLAGYLFVYEGRPVARPWLAQLTSAVAQIRSGTQPMTLLLVHGEVEPVQVEDAREAARAWLAAAWRHHEAACTP